MLERLASLDNPSFTQINELLEEHVSEPETNETSTPFAGALRVALDSAFGHDRVEQIFDDLQNLSVSGGDERVRQWAQETFDTLGLRSPTSLKVALAALRKGRNMQLAEALQMELNIATAYCVRRFLSASAYLLMFQAEPRESGFPHRCHSCACEEDGRTTAVVS